MAPITETPSMLEGGCHCGAITLAFSTARVPADTAPRACDCSFCRAHGAAWVSDAAAQLVLHAHRPDRVRRYRQGSLAAQFLLEPQPHHAAAHPQFPRRPVPQLAGVADAPQAAPARR